MRYFLLVLAGLGIMATLLPIIRTDTWWIRIFDFPRMQIAFLCAAAFVGLCFYLSDGNKWTWVVSLLVLGCVVHQLVRIYPYTPLKQREVLASDRSNSPRFELLVVNVRMENRDAQRFLDLVAKQNADLVLVNEPDQWWLDQLGTLDAQYPYSVKQPQDNTYGMLLYSRLPLHRSEVLFLTADDIPSVRCEVALTNRVKFEFFGIHPQPPEMGGDTDQRDAELVMVGKKAKASGLPTVVAGDLNDVAWSYTSQLFKRVSGLLDPRVGRGLFNTYNAFLPGLRYPLDHIFFDPAFRLLRIERLPAFGSDHFPVLIGLSYEPEHEDEQEAEVADQEDHQTAREILENRAEKTDSTIENP